MTRASHLGLTIGIGALAAAALAGCSSSSTSSPDATVFPSARGAECTVEAVQPAADEAATALGAENVYAIDDVQCSDGWAVAMGVLSESPTATSGAPTNFIFMDEDGAWVHRPQAEVCGTDPAATAAPADAAVPADLFTIGCAVS